MAVEKMTWDNPDSNEWRAHVYRYQLAGRYTKPTDVVADVACGIGYGREFLKGEWVGVDKDEGGTVRADLTTWVPDFDFDVFVGLETIEHLSDYTAYVRAAKRASRMIVISTPIIPTKHFNEFHLHDFTEDGVKSLFIDDDWELEHQERQYNIYGIYVFRRRHRPLVSIVVPTYKRHDLLLGRCLPSIAGQEYPNVETVVVSDGPDDELGRKIAELQKTTWGEESLRYVELGQNWGCYGGYGKLVGSYLARGDLIGYLDDDDEYTPNHISDLVKLQRHSGADFVYSKMHGPTKEGNVVTVGDGQPAFMKIGTPMFLHRRELLKKNQWRPSDNYCEDWELVQGWLKAECSYAFLNKITVLLRGARLTNPQPPKPNPAVPTTSGLGFSGYVPG